MASDLALVQKMQGWNKVSRWVSRNLKDLEGEHLETSAQMVGKYEQDCEKVISAKILSVEVDGDLEEIEEMIKNFDPEEYEGFEGNLYDNMKFVNEDTLVWEGDMELFSEDYEAQITIFWSMKCQGEISE